MELYYKVKRDSETGNKFADVFKREDECFTHVKAFLDKYGFKQYRPSRTSVSRSGISSVIVPKGMEVDKRIWRKSKDGDNEVMPRRNTKEGLDVAYEIDTMPIVDIDEINNIVGYDSDGWKSSHIGWSEKNEEYYGFSLLDTWKANIPSDCEEITGSEYSKLFS